MLIATSIRDFHACTRTVIQYQLACMIDRDIMLSRTEPNVSDSTQTL